MLRDWTGLQIKVRIVSNYPTTRLTSSPDRSRQDLDEHEATTKGEDALRAYCDAQRPGLINSTAAGIIEQMSSILPDVDKRALRESDELGVFMEHTMRKSRQMNEMPRVLLQLTSLCA